MFNLRMKGLQFLNGFSEYNTAYHHKNDSQLLFVNLSRTFFVTLILTFSVTLSCTFFCHSKLYFFLSL